MQQIDLSVSFIFVLIRFMFAKILLVQIFSFFVTLTKSPPHWPVHSLYLPIDERRLRHGIDFPPGAMTMALAWKTNERPGAPVLTAKMSFSPIASPANDDETLPYPHRRGNVAVGIFRVTDNSGFTPPCSR